MTHKKGVFLVLFVSAFFIINAFASSIRLNNNSPYDLRATIRGNHGKILGNVEVISEQIVIWEDRYVVRDYSELRPMNRETEGFSQTPYTVVWTIIDGGEIYSTCRQVASGEMVSAGSCRGYGRKPEEGNE